jgi:hypothetical protein
MENKNSIFCHVIFLGDSSGADPSIPHETGAGNA